jgi:hypothetical protein
VAFQRSWGLIFVAACQGSPGGVSDFGTAPGVTTAGSTGDSANVGSTGGTTGGAGGDSSGSGGDVAGEPARDLPARDFGDGAPAGCRGKIDFLFAISSGSYMELRQAELAAAFPAFIATIEGAFAEFDYHIMVVDGDGVGWGSEYCNDVCPDLGCLANDPCCTAPFPPAPPDQPCCVSTDYPCEELEHLTQCDRTWGAGVVIPAGYLSSNRRCPIEGGRRYLVKGQTDLAGTFACVATVGIEGGNRLGQALTAAMQPEINAPGGCNKGFLRDDALLMVTFVSLSKDYGGGGNESEGYPFQWAEAVHDAKHGDDRAVVMLQLGPQEAGEPTCHADDQICELVEKFPYHLRVSFDAVDLGATFAEAAALVETACAGFVPPG